ncbi:peptidyl-prolyl cis-trans isomerase CYP95-like protein isoform X1 [Tanacetum coccineum]|uniref:Peptidyl-prolyl cis-trans isomerase CYP95-like protein isoform X1 n=1 Tax=Tanacetum coccineum TaxID=301880 RepID=A0ABQ5HJT8_9ASTR
MNKKNPLVYLDVSIDGDPVERMVFELFADTVPKMAENFRALCTGEKGNSQKNGRPLHYKGSFFHRIIKGSLAQGGDFLKRDGSHGESIYGGKFPDESSKMKHDAPGLLTMAIADRDSRGSLFSVTLGANRHLDRKYVIFGKLVQGGDVLKKIENAGDEDGRPTVTVKIIYCGEISEGENQSSGMVDEVSHKKPPSKKSGKDVSSEVHSHEVKKKGKRKKSSKERRKKRKRYSSSDSDSSSDMESESSDSDSDSDSDISLSSSSSSDFSSSSDDRRKRKKRSSRKDRHRRSKRRDKRREKKRRKRDRKSKRRSKRTSDSESGGEDENGSGDNGDVKKPNRKHNNLAKITDGNEFPAEVEDGSARHKAGETYDAHEREEGEYPKENGDRPSNGVDVVKNSERPDVVNDHLRNSSRSISGSPQKALSKSMSISPRRSPSPSPRHNLSRSPSVSGSPRRVVPPKNRSLSRSLSPGRSGKSPLRSISRSPVRGKSTRSISPIPVRSRISKSVSRSPSPSPRRPSRKSVSRSPVRSARSYSRSPVRSTKRSLSRSSGRALPRRIPSRSPVRAPARRNSRGSRRSYSRSPIGGRRGRSPLGDRVRSLSRSASPDGSPKRIRRGRGFSNRYSYARRYHSPDRSPVRSYRYGRSDRDRYSSYRRRSPLRDRSPPRYRARRSRTRSPSVSRSPVRHRRRYSRSRSPVETSRYRPSPPVERRRAPRSRTPPSRSRTPPSRSRSPYVPSPRRTSKSKSKSMSRSRSRSRSSSGSPPAVKKGLVSYGDGSPDSSQKAAMAKGCQAEVATPVDACIVPSPSVSPFNLRTPV